MRSLRGRVAAALAALVLVLWLVPSRQAAQQASPAPAPSAGMTGPEFFRAADEVLAEMSQLLGLPVKAPLKKSIRTRAEIRNYVLREMQEDKEPAKRYADRLALERFGLLPAGFDLDGFLVDLLTEQIAGLYDPKAGEFYIADWIPMEEQRMVMAHELTHALQDQHFRIEDWAKAARPNDDGELARDAVVEGSALAAMVDYELRDLHRSIRDLDDIEPLVRQNLGTSDQTPELAKAPPFLRDALLFPYISGAVFTQRVLKSGEGWSDFPKVFAQPPASTQQVLHPSLYFSHVEPRPVTLPEVKALKQQHWKRLDENVFGEFGLSEVLKQFGGEPQAARLAPAWAGDRYAIYENPQSKRTLLIFRLRLASPEDAAHFFGIYGEALEKKYSRRSELFRRPSELFFQFSTAEGGVFLRCRLDQCLTVEGADRKAYDAVTRAIGWTAAPRPEAPRSPSIRMASTANAPALGF